MFFSYLRFTYLKLLVIKLPKTTHHEYQAMRTELLFFVILGQLLYYCQIIYKKIKIKRDFFGGLVFYF